jgi:hypothetical protein
MIARLWRIVLAAMASVWLFQGLNCIPNFVT